MRCCATLANRGPAKGGSTKTPTALRQIPLRDTMRLCLDDQCIGHGRCPSDSSNVRQRATHDASTCGRRSSWKRDTLSACWAGETKVASCSDLRADPSRPTYVQPHSACRPSIRSTPLRPKSRNPPHSTTPHPHPIPSVPLVPHLD